MNDVLKLGADSNIDQLFRDGFGDILRAAKKLSVAELATSIVESTIIDPNLMDASITAAGGAAMLVGGPYAWLVLGSKTIHGWSWSAVEEETDRALESFWKWVNGEINMPVLRGKVDETVQDLLRDMSHPACAGNDAPCMEWFANGSVDHASVESELRNRMIKVIEKEVDKFATFLHENFDDYHFFLCYRCMSEEDKEQAINKIRLEFYTTLYRLMMDYAVGVMNHNIMEVVLDGVEDGNIYFEYQPEISVYPGDGRVNINWPSVDGAERYRAYLTTDLECNAVADLECEGRSVRELEITPGWDGYGVTWNELENGREYMVYIVMEGQAGTEAIAGGVVVPEDAHYVVRDFSELQQALQNPLGRSLDDNVLKIAVASDISGFAEELEFSATASGEQVDLYLFGAGGNRYTLDAEGVSRILVFGYFGQDTATLTVENLSFINGKATDYPGSYSGGAIYSGGHVVVIDSEFHNNSAIRPEFATGTTSGRGGAIYASGDVETRGSTFEGNRATVGGGGIYARGDLTTDGSSFVENRALKNTGLMARGGAILAWGNVHSTDTEFSRNEAPSYEGSAIASLEGNVTTQDSTYDANVVKLSNPSAMIIALDGQLVDGGGNTFIGGNVSPFEDIDSTPIVLTAQSVVGGVRLNWEPISAASYYKIYRGTNEGVHPDVFSSYEWMGTHEEAPPLVLGGLDSEVTYYFVITAVIDGQETGPSNEVSAALQEPETFTVAPSSGTGGSMSPSNAQIVEQGNTASFTVNPNTGYMIESVTGCNGSLNGNTYTTGPITGDCTVSASFGQSSHTVSTTAGSGGGISPTSLTVEHEQTATFTVTPDEGYIIDAVSGCGGSLSGSTYTTGAITGNCTVSATFRQPDQLAAVFSVVPASAGLNQSVYAEIDMRSGEPPYTVTLNWGDGTSSGPETIAVANGNRVLTHFGYHSAGSYTVAVQVEDAAGQTYAKQEVVVVEETPSLTTQWRGYVTDYNTGATSDRQLTVVNESQALPESGETVSLPTYQVEGAVDQGVWSRILLPVPRGVINLDNRVRLTALVRASGQPWHDREAAFKTDSHLFKANFVNDGVKPEPPEQPAGVFLASNLANNATSTVSPVTFYDQVTGESEYSTMVMEIEDGWVNVYRLSGDSYTNQHSHYAGNAGAYLSELSLAFLGQGTLLLALLEYDLDGDGEFGSDERMVLNTGNRQVNWHDWWDGEAGPPPAVGSGKLNDTGIDWCADGSTNNLDCPVSGYEGQDGEYGRDAAARAGTLSKVGAGAAGFDFTKLDASGNDLAVGATEWSCVRDNHTGLIWEVKTTDGGLRDSDYTYSWYNSDSSTNGGHAGTQNFGHCSDIDCNTQAFVQAVNAVGLCGANDWRLPTVRELLGIVHSSQSDRGVDTEYFPNTPSWPWYWSSLPSASNAGDAWRVGFDLGGYVDVASKDGSSNRVRLVRGE